MEFIHQQLKFTGGPYYGESKVNVSSMKIY